MEAVAIALLVFGVYAISLNWFKLIQACQGKPRSSWIPFLGGLAGAIGLVVYPWQNLKPYWYLPLLADWGSIPGHIYLMIRYAMKHLNRVE